MATFVIALFFIYYSLERRFVSCVVTLL